MTRHEALLRRIRLCIAAALLACVCVPVAAAPVQRLQVVSDDNYPPYVFRGPDGRIQGLVVDLWSLWQRKTGVAVELQATDWGAAKQAFADGRAQVIDTIFRTPERERVMDFTAPYADLPVPIFVHKDIGGITGPASLRGFRVAAKAGDACIDRLAQDDVHDIEPFDSYEKIVAAAASGRVKIFCMDAPPANYLLYRSGANSAFRPAFVLYGGQFHRAVHKGDAATLALVERGFALIAPQERQALVDRWLGRTDARPGWLRVLAWGAAGLAAVLVLAFARGLRLRRAVREKSAEIETERSRLRTLLNALPDLVWLKNPQGAYLACNERFEDFTGIEEAALVGLDEHDLSAAHAAVAMGAADREVIALGKPARHEFELRFARDGHTEIVESLHVPVRDAQGGLLGALGIARDVTLRRDTERRLRRLNRLYRVITEVHAAILRERDALRLYDEVCRILVGAGELRMAWVGVPDFANDQFLPIAQAGHCGDYLEPPHGSIGPGPRGDTACARAYRSGSAAFATDLLSDPAMAPWHDKIVTLGFRSCSAFPLRLRGQVVAVFTVYSATLEYFDNDELDLLDTLSADIGRALETYELDQDRERAVQALRDSESRFATVFKTSPAGMAIGRFPEGIFIDVNQAFSELFGFALGDLVGRTGNDIGFWGDPRDRKEMIDRLANDGELRNFEVSMRTRTGGHLDISISATRMRIGADDLMLSAFNDLAPQRLARRTLEERKIELERLVAQRTAELSGVLDALPDLFFRMTADGTIVDYRAGRASDLFPATGSLLGMRVRDFLPQPAAGLIEAAIGRALASASASLVEYPLPMPQGEQIFEARLMPLGNGEVLSIVRNITDRKSLDAERERARQRAEELADAKSEFLANMSHEIRTPLNGLLGMAQIGLRESTADAQRQAFAAILGSGRLLLGIVNDVLDFSKIEVGQLRIERLAYSPRALAEDGAVLMRERALAKGIAFEVDCADDVPAQCEGDPLRIQQVLGNLVSNAVKFTEQGGVRIAVRVAPATEPAASRLQFTVEDSGIGIAPEQLRHLFMAFQQADTTTTRRFGGTGLGLAISRRLSELMGGEIRVQSRIGQGSRFELLLPLRPVSPDALQVPSASAWEQGAQRLQGVRVLIAEDNEVNQLVLERALVLEGAQVTVAADGQQAVDLVLAEGRAAYDVVLMDIQMPRMDGYEATRRLLELAPGLPVIGQTAHALVDERLECLAAGMVDHIAKPIEFRRLIAMIERLVGRA